MIKFDFFVAFASLAAMLAESLVESASVPSPSLLRALRTMRVLRMLRLMKSWKGLYKIVITFGKALPQMGNIFVLMFLIALIFSLLGMQVLGGAFKPDNGFYNEIDVETGYVKHCPNGVLPLGLTRLQ